jgi:hypothetical protein
MTIAELKHYRKNYYQQHKEYYKLWRNNNKPKVLEYHKRHRSQKRKYMIWYREKNKFAYQMYQKMYRERRRRTDPNFKVSENLRSRLNTALRHQSKTGSAIRDLGCSIEDFKTYITTKFSPGMTWDNYGEWELDHIIPLSRFNLTDRNQLLMALNYTNYQPLWKIDNIRKGDS